MANANRLYKKALLLEYFTVGYNILEAIASIVFGSIAGSVALIGFGLDSVVESLSGLVLIWRLRQHSKISVEAEERIEKKARRLVAATFFILGSYILYESIEKLIVVEIPEPSLAGIIIAILSIVIMPILTWQKYNTGKNINSRALMADAKENLACAFISVALLLGLGANYLFSFWQADPIVALIIVAFLFREGWEVWKESGEEEGGD
ncbi:MAG: cation transporter [Dehalococcoidia bacterium]|nr:MAG: cation transporter [Dehalococcoidia bacterium]